MERGERYWGDALAVVDVAKGDQGRFSYRDLNARANRMANWLRDSAGIGRGDRVGMLAMNGVEFLDVFFACGKLGAIFVPFNWRNSARELAIVVQQTLPAVMVFGDDFKNNLAQIRPDCPSLKHFIHLDGGGIEGSQQYDPLLKAQSAKPVEHVAVEAEDTICLLFTGGTTGLPKAAQISYRMIAWNTLNTTVHELRPGDVTISHTPMFHTGALFVYTLPLLTLGGTVVIMRKWTADEMLDLIEQERVSMMFCVPTQYQMMMQSPKFQTCSLKSVRFLTSGGAALPVHIIEAYRKQHAVVFKQGFGMTEFGPGVFSMRIEMAEKKAGSIGMPTYFVGARIVDDEDKDLPPDTVGELILKGPSMASGYFNAHGESIRMTDDAGWFHTGDLARMDEDGYFYIVDRKKDMFISGGENVYPAEIEEVLYQHAGVLQCAVIGLSDEKWGEIGGAVIVRKPGAEVGESELIQHCKSNLASYKVPRKVFFIEALPVSAAGKILKRELKLQFDK
ncbi:long-chain fatty acid--CoA ligase [soil metagenome]